MTDDKMYRCIKSIGIRVKRGCYARKLFCVQHEDISFILIIIYGVGPAIVPEFLFDRFFKPGRIPKAKLVTAPARKETGSRQYFIRM
jgi:hypothetical protein